jgi:hypothetical protein
MKNISVYILLTIGHLGFSQNATLSYIPDSCSYVINFDLARITSNISIDEADNFQFIKTITENFLQLDPKVVSLKTVGINYLGHAAYFSGATQTTLFSGTILPIEDEKLFINKTVSDNIIRQALLKNGSYVEGSAMYLVHDGFFIAATVSANEQLAFNMADSLFDANGWEKPFRWDFWSEDGFDFEGLEVVEEGEEAIEEGIIEEDLYENEEAINDPAEVAPPEEEFDEESELGEFIEVFSEFDDETRYYDIKDSILSVLSEKHALLFSEQLKSRKNKLVENSKHFNKALNRASDVTLFLNTTSVYSNNTYPYSLRRNPLLSGLDAYLQNTWQAGYMNFTPTGMTIDWLNHIGEKMTKVMSAMAKSKLDKKLLNYIPASTNGFMVVNMNTQAAYDKAKELFMPLLDQSEDADMMLASAIWSLIDEIINEEALFDMYYSKAFVSYNGIRDMVVQKTTYDYDPETFEYEEREETGIQQIPALTFGMSTSRSYLVTKFMNAMAAQENGAITKESAYYKIKSGPIPGVTFYLMVQGDIIILTNEQDMVRNNPSGYGKNALSGTQAKKAGNTQLLYAQVNLDNIPDELNELITNPSDRKFIRAISEKPGDIEFEMGEMNKDSYSLKATYTFHGKNKSGAHYLMEILNLMMSYEDEYYDDF